MHTMIRLIKNLYHLAVAMVALVRFRFPSRRLVVIGVTGTDGKTTTTTLIYDILRKAGIKVSMITSVHAVIAGKSYDTGFHVTTPDAYAIQKYLRRAVDAGDTHMVLEVTSHGLAQHRVFGVQFTVGVITNVTPEHLDWHKSFEHYRKTKLSLLSRAKVAVVNRDEAELFNKAMPLLNKKKVVTYGIRRDAMVSLKNYPLTTPLMGEFNKYNCLAALAASSVVGIEKKAALAAIRSFEGVVGRMEVVATKPCMVIVDFAHTPNAIDRALRTAREYTKKRLIHVFGSAGLRDASKRPAMGKSSSAYADQIILTEEDYRTENVEDIMDAIQQGIPADIPVARYVDRGDAIRYALSIAGPGDVVIITGKGHEKSLCRGKKEFPWSDQDAVTRALAKKGKS